eukprot:CAMPEP_0176050606 /NCGR_PEP_ID=MMETSP0120_2-20121206/25154_1 /TAXON_ID=160619 /ORGANISM="Kryptoperidinium foliaceum, Strain CCMP 1326" /LENGTH=550 /DNA_ID=CAMNT_0017384041 /DNA_START=34 /DNA_END=1687 /DNA_ORIENTATION=+
MQKRLIEVVAAAGLMAGALAEGSEGGMLRAHYKVRWLAAEAPSNTSDQEFIWGGCEDSMDPQGCQLKGGHQCSSYLSDGPEDADVSITLYGPPVQRDHRSLGVVGRAQVPSLLQAIAKPIRLHGLQGPPLCVPAYDEAEFNGGNVEVNETGEATIRIRQPATYVVGKWILYPHIHIRLCSGENLAKVNPDTIFFTRNGPVFVSGFHGQDHDTVLSDSQEWGSSGSTSGVEDGGASTSVSPSGIEDDRTINQTNGLIDSRMEDARNSLDLDGLEFSPVYTCLMKSRFYSYFTASCVEKCPEFADVHVGQCVRKETSQAAQTVEAAWRVELECGEHCWHDKLNVTMHHLRLKVGNLLDIPFQEVERAGLQRLTERRLEAAGGVGRISASMSVVVRSKRIDPVEDGPKLKTLVTQVSGASWLLGFVVHGVEPMVTVPVDEGSVIVSITDSSDPYASAYDEAASSGIEIPGVDGAEVPIWAVVTGAVLACCAVSSIGGFLWYRRKKAPMVQEVQGTPVVRGAPGPTKATTLGASAVDEDSAPRAEKPGAASSVS